MLEEMGFAKGGTAVVVGGATIAGFFAAACSLVRGGWGSRRRWGGMRQPCCLAWKACLRRPSH